MPPPTLVHVDPSEFAFDVQGGRLDEVRVKIQNLTDKRVGFKFFTDQSDLYVIQPKSGFVDKRSIVEVGVKLLRIPDHPAAIDHVTVVKARIARDDEIDREKEWRTATPADEADMQVVRMKSRFRTAKSGDEDVLTALRRLEKKFDDRFDALAHLIRFTMFGIFVVLVAVVLNMYNNDSSS